MSGKKDPFAQPIATTDGSGGVDDFDAALDHLEDDVGETTEATSLINISQLDVGQEDLQLEEDVKRARALGVSMANSTIESLPESPRAVIDFSDDRPPLPVTKSVFVIGRSKEFADVVIAEENVSRHHAALIFASGEFFIEDLNSTNGTRLRGKRIRRSRLDPDTPIRIGTVTFKLRWEF